MRIVRYADATGEIGLGALTADDFAVPMMGELYGTLEPAGEPVPVAAYLAPVQPANIFAIGLNYGRHAEETGASLSQQPIVFMKATTSVTATGSPIRLPACSQGPEVDFEGELAVVIGRPARDVDEAFALGYVLGYTCANDVSARRWQKHGGGGQWVRGKSFDTFCPLGPVLATADEISDPQRLTIRTRLNGELMQEGSTADMIFPVARLISFLSQDTTLLPGTVILTGTPPGVGFARQPPVFLCAGDQIEVEIEGIGRLVNPVVGA